MNGKHWLWNRETCQSQGGDLVSIETEEEWNFINDQIQNRSTVSSCSCDYAGYHNDHCDTWYIGLKKKGKNWTWVNGKLMNMSKWNGKPMCMGAVAHICKQSIDGEQGLFYNIHESRDLAYICEIPKGKTKLLFISNAESKRHAKSTQQAELMELLTIRIKFSCGQTYYDTYVSLLILWTRKRQQAHDLWQFWHFTIAMKPYQ